MRISLDKAQDMPIREKQGTEDDAQTLQGSDLSIQLHPIPSREGLLVKVHPPREPAQKINHVPVDIVLVIDVSGSMNSRADVPGEDSHESAGLTVLDLVRHAAMTIIETLDEGDRLGIVTFSNQAHAEQALTVMNDENKEFAKTKINSLYPKSATNLWGGIKEGVKVVNDGGSSPRVPSIMVLTDGKPNFMCPPQGYVHKMQSMLPLPAAISTFGFGYKLDSGLLKSIAEIGGGSYAFIPDAGMIGTVFVHAVANLQSTYATDVSLNLWFKQPLQIEETTGHTVDQLPVKEIGDQMQLKIKLGNVQYGQSRDVFLKVTGVPTNDPFDKDGLATISADLHCGTPSEAIMTPATETDEKTLSFDSQPSCSATCSMLSSTDLQDAEIAFHETRSRICGFVSSMFPVNFQDTHQSISKDDVWKSYNQLKRLIPKLPAQEYTDEHNQSLIKDLVGSDPHGQVSLALKQTDYYEKWGQHYLPSLLNAHVKQACNSFKDPGPLQYGLDSPLFIQCREKLDDAFGNLPAPEPSLTPARGHGGRISMRSYHNSSGVCFAGSTPVELASGRFVAIRKLRRGVNVRTPLGPRKVAAVLKTAVEGETLCRVSHDVLVTPWHPISDDAKNWAFPATVTDKTVRYTGRVYSVMLQPDGDGRAHGIRVGRRFESVWGVTLGHGMVSTTVGDVRAHPFFGDYFRLVKAMIGLGIGKTGVVKGTGVVRDARTNNVVGFRMK